LLIRAGRRPSRLAFGQHLRVTDWTLRALETAMKRYAILYLATALVMLPLDLLFLGFVAKGFFNSQIGDMLGEVRLTPAILFYLIYVGGIVLFVSGSAGASWQSSALFGALLGLVCYATFELTAMSLLKHWTWPVVVVDMSWGMVVTAAAAALGLLLGNWVMAKI
jgi:uncharacterized membrane protein